VTVALKPQATISGRVLVNGRPQADVGVSAYVEAGAGAVATTATDGTYTLRNLNAGAVEVMAQAPEGIARTAEQKITVKMGQAVTGVDFSLSPGAVIRGKISDDTDGKPVASASVVAAGTEGPAGAGTRSKDDGTYELRIPPGSYSLTCRGPDLDYVGRSSADLAAGQMLTLKEGDVVEGKDFAIKAPRRLQIQVLLPDGRPATNAKVMELDGPASRQGMGIQREAVRPGGLFDWRVSRTTPQTDPWVYHPEPALIITDAEQNLAAMVSAKALPDPPTITLRPAATATVLVTDAQGQPLRNFAVSVGYPKGEQDWMQSEPVFPDETGLIRMTCLPVGIRLRVFPAPDLQRLMLSDSLRNPEFILNAGEVRQLSAIVVNPQGGSLNMFVGDVDGKPVKGAEVYAGDARTPVFTDAQGKVTLSKLPAQGKIMLLAVHPTQDLFAIETADPNAGTWPGLLVKPRGKATGILMLAQGGKPLAGRQVSCEIMRGPNWNWQLPRALVQRLGLEGPSQVTMTDAEGRWRQGNLIPGAEYRVVIWHTVSDTRREGAGSSGPFKVLGGEEEQDTGKMECNLPPGQ
ncbi:MAG: carboxypeptidase regulatory-like domain-containing protein, partial [Armatimonadia bacterium]